jgi:hypothetical protein
VNKFTIVVAGVLAVAGIAMAQPANAAGCMRGAMAGGLVGHFAGHHGLVGAGIGCAIGHHEATRRARENYRNGYGRY